MNIITCAVELREQSQLKSYSSFAFNSSNSFAIAVLSVAITEYTVFSSPSLYTYRELTASFSSPSATSVVLPSVSVTPVHPGHTEPDP